MPLIGVTGRTIPAAEITTWTHHALATPKVQMDALQRAGAIGVVVMAPEPVMRTERYAFDLVEHLDGVLLSGGVLDLDPRQYGQSPIGDETNIDPVLDQFELDVTRAALQLGIPIFGICRGMQILNVALGGSLHQDIAGHHGLLQHDLPHHESHVVRLSRESQLATVLRTTELACNSHHHQALDRLGDDVVAIGHTSDGVVEAIEVKAEVWTFGVQWHPEDDAAVDMWQQNIFDRFADAVREAMATRRLVGTGVDSADVA